MHCVHGVAPVRATPERVSRRNYPAIAACTDFAPDVPAIEEAVCFALATLYNFWVAQNGGLTPFAFYNPFEPAAGQPVGSNYDATGSSIQGRYTVVFRGSTWTSGYGRVPELSAGVAIGRSRVGSNGAGGSSGQSLRACLFHWARTGNVRHNRQNHGTWSGDVTGGTGISGTQVFPLKTQFGFGFSVDQPIDGASVWLAGCQAGAAVCVGTGPRKFQFKRAVIRKTEVDQLRAFWESMQGPWQAFTYNVPNADNDYRSGAGDIRAGADVIPISGKRGDTGLNLIEVVGAASVVFGGVYVRAVSVYGSIDGATFRGSEDHPADPHPRA